MKAVYSASLANLFHVTVFGRELARADGEAAGRIRAPGAAPGWAAGSTLPTGRLRGLRAPGALGYVLGTPIPPPWMFWGGGFGGVGASSSRSPRAGGGGGTEEEPSRVSCAGTGSVPRGSGIWGDAGTGLGVCSGTAGAG